MRPAVLLLLAALILAALAGCGKPAQTTATQVTSAPDRLSAPPATARPPMPAPPPPRPKPASTKAGLVSTKSGLQYHDLKVGRGPEAKSGMEVTVNYKGWLDDGTVFDSSQSHGKPFEFVLGKGKGIPGWDEGVAGMRVGGSRELVVPPSLGYGATGSGSIPPNSTLHFEIELLAVRK